MNHDSEPADVSSTESAVTDWLDGAAGHADPIAGDGVIDKSRAADLLWINALAELAHQAQDLLTEVKRTA